MEFDNLGDFLLAVAAAASGDMAPDRRLQFASIATGAGGAVPSEGGFVLPETFASELWQSVYETGALLARCTGQPLTVGEELKLPAIDEASRASGSRFGGIALDWVAEGETVAATKPKFRRLTLALKKLLGVTYATDELLADAPALGAWLRRLFALEAAFEVEDAIINGTGLGRPLGILKSEALITVAAESGQGAGTIVPANLVAMGRRLWPASHRSAVWLTGSAGWAQLAGASFSNGAPVVTYAANGHPYILGMPLELVEYTSELGSLGDVVLADLSQYLVAERDVEFPSSIHVRFLWNESTFKLRYRVDGQPAWASPITPANDAVTVSPFVALEARP